MEHIAAKRYENRPLVISAKPKRLRPDFPDAPAGLLKRNVGAAERMSMGAGSSSESNTTNTVTLEVMRVTYVAFADARQQPAQ